MALSCPCCSSLCTRLRSCRGQGMEGLSQHQPPWKTRLDSARRLDRNDPEEGRSTGRNRCDQPCRPQHASRHGIGALLTISTGDRGQISNGKLANLRRSGFKGPVGTLSQLTHRVVARMDLNRWSGSGPITVPQVVWGLSAQQNCAAIVSRTVTN